MDEWKPLVAGGLRAVHAAAPDAPNSVTNEVPVFYKGLKHAAGAAVAAGWGAVHAVISVPLHRPQGVVDVYDTDGSGATELLTQTLPRLLAGVVVGMSTIPGQHVLAPLRAMGTLLAVVVRRCRLTTASPQRDTRLIPGRPWVDRAWFQRLDLKHHEALLNFALTPNSRRYIVASDESSSAAAVECIETAMKVPQPFLREREQGSAPATAMLGRYVVRAVWDAVKSSRHRKVRRCKLNPG